MRNRRITQTAPSWVKLGTLVDRIAARLTAIHDQIESPTAKGRELAAGRNVAAGKVGRSFDGGGV